MSTITQINQILEDTGSLQLIAEAYSEIAAIKLQKIRAGIERNRQFFQEVLMVYRAVKIAAERKNITTKITPKGAISVLLTSNQRFYGDLEKRLIEYFIDNTKKFPTDRVVIGHTARDLLKSINFPYPYQTLLFKNDIPTTEEIANLVAKITPYQQIYVYYARMKSVLVQEPHVVDLLQRPPEIYLTNPYYFHYIFEPEVEEILDFFNNQITALLLEQTMLESELARTASRLISMDQAQTQAEKLIRDQRKLLFTAKKSIDHARLLDTLASLSLRKKGEE